LNLVIFINSLLDLWSLYLSSYFFLFLFSPKRKLIKRNLSI
jgi:hypothetical protein